MTKSNADYEAEKNYAVDTVIIKNEVVAHLLSVYMLFASGAFFGMAFIYKGTALIVILASATILFVTSTIYQIHNVRNKITLFRNRKR